MAVVDGVIGAEGLYPVAADGARGAGDDGGVGQRFRQLDGDRSDAARAADDEYGIGGACYGTADVQPLKQGFPGGGGKAAAAAKSRLCGFLAMRRASTACRAA